ncbi:MAG: hypothetical protein IT517_19445 [Burkholderiales bacterium]|nr:hypothetical protein [Burkholderiales bacterium]MCC7218958.1 hypothetical protein [Burkholderiales bacterium]
MAPVAGDGEFTSRGFTMPVSSAIAFRGKWLVDEELSDVKMQRRPET